MKSNKGLIIAVLAGVTVAGFLGFLFGTEKGKDLRTKMLKNRGKLFNQANQVFAGVKQKVSNLKDEMVKEGRTSEKFSEQFQDM